MEKVSLKKRIFATALSLSMMVLFVGCNGSSTENSSDTTNNDTQETTTVSDESSNSDNSTEIDKTTFDDMENSELIYNMQIGWNLGNQMEASFGGNPDETAWGNPTITQELISAVAEAGFKTIRVPVSYLKKIGTDENYTVDPDWLDRVQEVVDYCYNEGLYVIINMHGDGYNTVDGGWLLVNGDDQETICTKYQSVWTQIAEKFKDYDEHLIFESMNEEFDDTYDDPNPEYYANLNKYNQIFVDTVRSTGGNNELRWLLVPGWNTNINYTVGDYGFKLPTDTAEDKLIVSVHYYDPYEYALNESLNVTGWGLGGKRAAKWGNEDYVEEQFQKLEDAFISKNIPVIIGEYGAVFKTQNKAWADEDSHRYYLEYVTKSAREHSLIPVYWDNGWNGDYGFSLFDRTNGEQLHSNFIEAIIRASENQDYEIQLPENYDASKLEGLDKNPKVEVGIGVSY
ncbi:MAG: glycoside hydrolase family 5 protein [Oscillospiraceae bacterium]